MLLNLVLKSPQGDRMQSTASKMTLRNGILIIAVLGLVSTDVIDATNVTVVFPGLPSTGGTCHLPLEFDVDLRMLDDSVMSMQLTKNKDENLPVFISRKNPDGSASFIPLNPLAGKNVALYQDAVHEAEFQVTCENNATYPLILNGTLVLSDGKFYSLEKFDNIYTLTEETLDQSIAAASAFDDDKSDPSAPVPQSMMRLITNDIYIDVIALIEYTVYQKWYSRSEETTAALKRTDALENIARHFTHMFNAVNLRYKTASSRINMNLVGFVIEDTASGTWFQSVLDTEPDQAFIDASQLLDTQHAFAQTTGFPSHDHLVSFTALDIYWMVGGSPSYTLAGLATVGQICKENGKSVSTVEYQDHFVVDVFITAHEIGHSFSARHDGTDGNICVAADNYIMTAVPSVYTNTNPFTFSSCSADYFDNHVNTLLASGNTYSTTCLLEPLQSNSVPVVTEEDMPGQILGPDDQCRRKYGQDSYVCRGIDVSDVTVCLKLSCHNPADNLCYHLYADRGTTCGNKMWCDGLQCVYSENAPATDPNCILGDQPAFPDGTTCSDRITSTTPCSNAYYQTRCCEKCKEVTCSTQACQNNGFLDSSTCNCVCPQYYTGTLCETCSKVCQNGGSIDMGTCECSCSADWTGVTCEISMCTKVCGNGGTLNAGTCQCDCLAEWTGVICETSTCTKVCGNGGTLDPGKCQCDCLAQYSGDICEICLNSCPTGQQSNPANCICMPNGVVCNRPDPMYCTPMTIFLGCRASIRHMIDCPQTCGTCEKMAPNPLTNLGYD